MGHEGFGRPIRHISEQDKRIDDVEKAHKMAKTEESTRNWIGSEAPNLDPESVRAIGELNAEADGEIHDYNNAVMSKTVAELRADVAGFDAEVKLNKHNPALYEHGKFEGEEVYGVKALEASQFKDAGEAENYFRIYRLTKKRQIALGELGERHEG